MCADYDISNDSFYNPQTKTETWYYTVIGLYSASPFVPAVLFTTQEGTLNTTITESVTGLTLTPATANVEQGGQLALVSNIVGTLAATPATATVPPTLSVAPDSVTYELAAADSDDVAIDLDPYETHIDRFGILHVGTTVPVGTVITVTATSTYNDGTSEPETATGTYTVIAPTVG